MNFELTHSMKPLALAVAVLGSLVVMSSAQARDKKFACPMPNGVTCMSAEDVYEATHNTDSLIPAQQNKPAKQTRQTRAAKAAVQQQQTFVAQTGVNVGGEQVPTPDRCCDPVFTAVTVRGDTLAVASPQFAPSQQQLVDGVYVNAPSINTPRQGGEVVVRTRQNEAFREPARVMRILVNPWIDQTGDLHLGGFVLTEIEPRRWSVGTAVAETSNPYRLIGVSPVRETAQDARTGAGIATPAAGRPEGVVASQSY